MPAPFPSVLRTSGRNLVDASGYVMPLRKGINVQVQTAAWTSSDFAAMAAEGVQVVCTVIYWDRLQPNGNSSGTGPPASGTDFSGISSSFVALLDAHVQHLYDNGMYTTFKLYFGPQNNHVPTWTDGTSKMENYVTYGQSATNYLAQRYGDPSNPLGAPDAAYAAPGQGKYTPLVVGLELNEITPDDTTVNSWQTTLISEFASSMIPWMRAYAPAWIACISGGFGGAAPIPNAAGSGHTDQTFTGIDHTVLDAAGGNYMMVIHFSVHASTDGSDGRNTKGLTDNTTVIKDKDPTNSGGNNFTTYPPTVAGTLLTRAQCQAIQGMYFAPYVDYCTAHNVPLMVGEWSFVPFDGTVTYTGGDLWIADAMIAFANAAPVIEMQWDYGTNQASDKSSARPGTGAVGVDANGWQTATNLFFAAHSGDASQPVTVTASAAGNVAAAPAASLTVTVTPAAAGSAAAGSITPPGTPYIVGHHSISAASNIIPVITPLNAGDTLVLCWGAGGATDSVTSASDTQGNAYTTDNAQAGSGRACGFCYVVSAAGLSISDTITAVFASGTSANRVTAIGIPGVSGIDLAPAGAGGISASPSASTGTLSQQEEICVGVMSLGGTTAPSGLSWTLIENFASAPFLTVTYTLPGSSTVSQANSAVFPSASWGAAVITLKGVTASGALAGAAPAQVTAAAAADGNTGARSGAAPAVTIAAAASGTVAGTASRAVTVTGTAGGGVAAATAAPLLLAAAPAASGNVAAAAAAAVPVTVTAAPAADADGTAAQAVTAAAAAAGSISAASSAARPVTAAASAAGTGLGRASRPVTVSTPAAGNTATASGTIILPVAAVMTAAGNITSAPGAAATAVTAATAAAGNMAAAGGAALAVTAAVTAAGNMAAVSDAAVPVTAATAAAGNTAAASAAALAVTAATAGAAAASPSASLPAAVTIAAAGNAAVTSAAARPVTAATAAAGTGRGAATLAAAAATAAAGNMAAAADAVPAVVVSVAAVLSASGTVMLPVAVTAAAGGISGVVAFAAPAVLPVAVRTSARGHGAGRKAASAGAVTGRPASAGTVTGRHASKPTVTAGGPP